MITAGGVWEARVAGGAELLLCRTRNAYGTGRQIRKIGRAAYYEEFQAAGPENRTYRTVPQDTILHVITLGAYHASSIRAYYLAGPPWLLSEVGDRAI